MLNVSIDMKPKKDEVLYVTITKENKERLNAEASRLGTNKSELINKILDCVLGGNGARKQAKFTRSSEATY